jgi:hypothetical protein
MTASTQHILPATLPLPFAEEALRVLGEIDVRATLQATLQEDVEPHPRLAACSPRDARRVLAPEPELGTLLPCNVIVSARESEPHGAAIVDASVMLGIGENPSVEPLAAALRERRGRAFSAAGAATAEVA